MVDTSDPTAANVYDYQTGNYAGTAGTAGTASIGSCTIDFGASSYSAKENDASLALSVAFAASFSGNHLIDVSVDGSTYIPYGYVNVAPATTAFTTSTTLTATPNSITTAQSTTLQATVGGTPATSLAGTVSFSTSTSQLGSCGLNGGTCSFTVPATALQLGANAITATYGGVNTYPASTSNPVNIIVSAATNSQTITFGSLPNVNYPTSPITLTATASSGLVVTYTVTGPATVSGSTLNVTGAGVVTVTALQNGDANYSAAPSVQQSFTATASVVSGSTVLSETATLTLLSDGNYQAIVKITNSGTGTAQNVVMTTAVLGTANTLQALPSALANIAPGASITSIFTFPSSAGAHGAAAVLKLGGTYKGGNFAGSIRVTLPQSAS